MRTKSLQSTVARRCTTNIKEEEARMHAKYLYAVDVDNIITKSYLQCDARLNIS